MYLLSFFIFIFIFDHVDHRHLLDFMTNAKFFESAWRLLTDANAFVRGAAISVLPLLSWSHVLLRAFLSCHFLAEVRFT